MSSPQPVLASVSGSLENNPYLDTLNRQKAAFKRRGAPTCDQRKENLTRLQKAEFSIKINWLKQPAVILDTALPMKPWPVKCWQWQVRQLHTKVS